MRKQILPKTDSRYWLQPGKLKLWEGSATYSVYVQWKGKRHSFTLGTRNKEAAARLAAGICNDLVNLGAEATLAKHRPQRIEAERVATVGEWITAAQRVATTKASTFDDYARCLRVIVSGILQTKKANSRFSPHKGGFTDYRATIDAVSLDILTLPAIQRWRLSYVAQAETPRQKQSRMTSCNSTVRQARSLFSTRIVKFVQELRLPDPVPFVGAEFFPRQNTRYQSKIVARTLLQAAKQELSVKEPAAFLALLLALGAGLRKSEIDTLCWNQIDTVAGLIRVEVTEVASLKTQDSQGEVEIDEDLASILQEHRIKTKAKESDFVIDCTAMAKQSTRRSYRAGEIFDKLTIWLRTQGVTARKPLHEMRKELGSLITQEHGIYAASRALRHSNVATTAAYYADKKARTTVPIGSWINPPKAVPTKKVRKPAAGALRPNSVTKSRA